LNALSPKSLITLYSAKLIGLISVLSISGCANIEGVPKLARVSYEVSPTRDNQLRITATMNKLTLLPNRVTLSNGQYFYLEQGESRTPLKAKDFFLPSPFDGSQYELKIPWTPSVTLGLEAEGKPKFHATVGTHKKLEVAQPDTDTVYRDIPIQWNSNPSHDQAGFVLHCAFKDKEDVIHRKQFYYDLDENQVEQGRALVKRSEILALFNDSLFNLSQCKTNFIVRRKEKGSFNDRSYSLSSIWFSDSVSMTISLEQ
jgi:hypothetical protein